MTIAVKLVVLGFILIFVSIAGFCYTYPQLFERRTGNDLLKLADLDGELTVVSTIEGRTYQNFRSSTFSYYLIFKFKDKKGQIQETQILWDKFKFTIDDSIIEPKVEFIFDDSFLNEKQPSFYVIFWSEKDIEIFKSSFNMYAAMITARLRLPKSFKDQPFLSSDFVKMELEKRTNDYLRIQK